MDTEPGTGPVRDYRRTELMAICAAREVRDGEVAFIGTGLPMLGGMLAKHLHAPHSILVFESGVVDARPTRTPLSIGDACLVPGSPKVRLPGSGGGNDIGSLAKRFIVMMKQDVRKFVPRVDYVTTPGYLDGPPCPDRPRP